MTAAILLYKHHEIKKLMLMPSRYAYKRILDDTHDSYDTAFTKITVTPPYTQGSLLTPAKMSDQRFINKAVPGADQYYPLNDPPIGSVLPAVSACPSLGSQRRRS